ncbi:MAG: septum formation initiator family protein [Bacillota bacterium]
MQTTTARRRFNPVKSRLPVMLLIVLMTYFSVSLGFQLNKLWAMQNSIMEMKDQVVQLRSQNEYLWERLTILQSEGYIEETARERLGLIRPGEVRIVPVLPEDSGGQIPDRSIKD